MGVVKVFQIWSMVIVGLFVIIALFMPSSHEGIELEYDEYAEAQGDIDVLGDPNLETVVIGGKTYLHAVGIGSGKVSVDGEEKSYRVTKAVLDVFAFCGQSNASYFDYNRAEAPVPAPGTGYYYGKQNVPVWRWEEELAPEGYSNFWNPADCAIWDMCTEDGTARIGDKFPGFAAQWHEKTGRRCLVIPCAIGGMRISYFSEGASMWQHTSNVIAEAVSLLDPDLYEIHSRAYVWIQGEADSSRGTSEAYYESAWKAWNEAMKAGELGLPFDACFMSKVKVVSQAIIDAQDELARTVPRLYSTDVARGFTEENGRMGQDGIHYTQIGDNEIAERFGRMMAEAYPDLDKASSNAVWRIVSGIAVIVLIASAIAVTIRISASRDDY